METVLVSGGTGLIGKHLIRKLQDRGYEVSLLSRKINQSGPVKTYFWDPEKSQIDPAAIIEADYIIHLAGAGIGDKRWTKRRKLLIINSRVKPAELLFSSFDKGGKKLKAFISASAVGYYGAITSDSVFSEDDPPSDDFLGITCRNWEIAADRFEKAGTRTVKIRTGVVLTKKGGALGKIAFLIKIGIGSALGSGNQYFSWIHIDDLCNIYIKAIEDIEMKGAYNAVAPDQMTNKEFTRILASVMKKPFWFPDIPAILMRIFYGKMSDILLKGSRISCEKIRTAGYVFLFPGLESALNDLFGIR